MFSFKVKKQPKKSPARVGEIETNHGKIQTPVFMPCATVGAVKGISAEELKDIGFEIILSNTYHLYLRPGEAQVKKMGGVQEFINWQRPILTDSGGYQVFSLGNNFRDYESKSRLSLVKITDKGVWFKSHLDGSKHFFSPEKVIDIQLALGSDIIMPLDYCPSADADREEIAKAVELTNQWFERAWKHFEKKTRGRKNRPAIFAIVQGGPYRDLRQKSLDYLKKFPVDGFAIGGVANGGESKEKQRRALKYTIEDLPSDKPRYLMGVGEPEDIIAAVKLGVDMFDCVLPTRLGRHGTIWTTSNWQKFSKIDLKKTRYQNERQILMKNCLCPTCRAGYTKSYVNHLFRANEMLSLRLASLHNLWVLANLMTKIRQGIVAK